MQGIHSKKNQMLNETALKEVILTQIIGISETG